MPDVSDLKYKAEDLKEKVTGYLPAKKEEKKADDSSLFPKPLPEKPITTTAIMGAETREKEKALKNQALERKLSEMVLASEQAVKDAIAAKNAVVTAISHHAKMLRDALEDPQTSKDDAVWTQVNTAYSSMKHSESVGDSKTNVALKELERLRQYINEGKSDKLTAANAAITSALDKLNHLVYEVDEWQAKVRQAQTEEKIMRDFKELVQKGRDQFAKELKSILPNVNIHAKGEKMSEDDLNALIAHAHLRVDQIRKQLTEQQLREELHIKQALDRQKAEDQRNYDERLDRELRRAQDDCEVDVSRKLNSARGDWEDELRLQLRRNAAAHSEHLEEVLRVQQEQHQIDSARKVEEAILHEKELFNRDVAVSLAKLKGIETALEGRADLDAENRHAKELWLACQNLRDSILYGKQQGYNMETRRKPLANEVMAVKEAGAVNAFVGTLVHTIPDAALRDGVYTEEDLYYRFQKVKRLCRRVAMIGDNGGSLFDYFVSLVQSMFILDSYHIYSPDDLLDPHGMGTFALLDRASYFVREGDFETAIRLLHLMRGEAARVARSWIEDARMHLEAKQTSDALIAHAAAISYRTVY